LSYKGEKKTQAPSKKGATSTKKRLKDIEAALEILVIGLFHINFYFTENAVTAYFDFDITFFLKLITF
jgi:hypothetical protein